MTGPLRTLPLRLEPVAGEALDSWIEALARRYRIAARPMLGILGIPRAPTFVRTLLDRVEPAGLRRIEQAAGVAPGLLDAAVGADIGPVDRLHSGGSRFCPRLAWPPPEGAGRTGGA